jgi:hypothetical protein
MFILKIIETILCLAIVLPYVIGVALIKTVKAMFRKSEE